MNFWPTMALHFTLIVIIFCHVIPKNQLSSYISVITIQFRLFLTTLIQTSIKIVLLTLLSESDTPLESFNPHTSNKTIALPEPNLHSPTYQKLPSSTPLDDSLDDTFNSTDSDFEMHQDPYCQSNCFPQFYSRFSFIPLYLLSFSLLFLFGILTRLSSFTHSFSSSSFST